MSTIWCWLLVNAWLLGRIHNGREGRGVRGQDLSDWRLLMCWQCCWPSPWWGNVEQPRGMAVGIANDTMPMMVVLQLRCYNVGFPQRFVLLLLVLLLFLKNFLHVTQLLMLELVLPNEAISFVKVPDEGVVTGVILGNLVILVVLVVLQCFRRG